MTPERWQQIETIFQSALTRAPEQRATFLDDACGGDEALRGKVEAMLQAHEQAGSFLDTPVAEVAADLIAEDDARWTEGATIGPYQIVRRLGAGGMGEVYLAHDTRLGRPVALKLLPDYFTTDKERGRRFRQEARAASALNHANVATIYEIGAAEGITYIAMEYVEGQTLDQKLSGRPLDAAEIVDMATQVGDALEEAHAKGIIHRDIKPGNIMLTARGQVKVLDFGLAKMTRQEREGLASDLSTQARTQPGLLMGTVAYMSPEQALGHEVDHRTDIFSLGVVMYEMTTGQRPFTGTTTGETLDAIIHAEPEAVARFNSNVPAELERIIRKCLEKDREQRYQSARELLVDLRNLKRAIELGAATAAVVTKVRGRRLLRSRQALALAAVVVLAVAVLIYARLFRGAPTVVSPEIKSLAVLPLENLSGDPAQEYFADGMTEALITELGKIGALRVISRPSVMKYKGTRTPLPKIAQELKVDAVVVGSVVRSADRVRITTQLVEAATERQLLSESYEHGLRDVLELQSEVAQTIAREIRITITPAEQARLANTRPVNRQAYDDYLQGRYLYSNKRTEENLRKAIEYFQSAIKEDSGFALAYAGLAECYNGLGTVMFSGLPPTEARRRAEEAAEKALEFDSGLAEAHVALGVAKHYNWNWAAAEQEFRRAIDLNPNYPDAHLSYALYLVSRGRAEEAITEANRAQQLDPLSLAISAGRGFVLENARRLDEAIEQFRRTIAMDPNHYQAHWFLGHTYAANGQLDEAIATSEKAAALSGRAPGALGFLGMAYGLAGRQDEANKVLNELLDINRRHYVTPPAVASVYISLGNKDQAFAWLEKAYQERSYYMAYLKVFPLMDPLRSDPRFDDLLQRIGLQP